MGKIRMAKDDSTAYTVEVNYPAAPDEWIVLVAYPDEVARDAFMDAFVTPAMESGQLDGVYRKGMKDAADVRDSVKRVSDGYILLVKGKITTTDMEGIVLSAALEDMLA